MSTYGQIQDRLINAFPELSPTRIADIINSSYQRLLSRRKWSFLYDVTNLSTIAPYTTGTVDVTQGSATVTGTSTVWTSAMVGRQLRVADDSGFYKIKTVTPPDSITLDTVYAGITKTAQGYSIFQNLYSLSSSCRNLLSIVYQMKLIEKDLYFVDRYDPDRLTTGQPEWFIKRGKDSNGYLQIELWPIPDDAYPLRYSYIKSVSDMSKDSDLPVINSTLLEMEATIECLRWSALIPSAQAPQSVYRQQISEAIAMRNELYLECMRDDRRNDSEIMNTLDKMFTIEMPASDSFWAAHDSE
jgi:hypothetical protein